MAAANPKITKQYPFSSKDEGQRYEVMGLDENGSWWPVYWADTWKGANSGKANAQQISKYHDATFRDRYREALEDLAVAEGIMGRLRPDCLVAYALQRHLLALVKLQPVKDGKPIKYLEITPAGERLLALKNDD